MQSKLSPGPREPQELKRTLGMTEQITFKAKMESNIQVGQTLRTGVQTQIRLRPGHTHFSTDSRKTGRFRNNHVLCLFDRLTQTYQAMQPCSGKHIARKTPVPCYGLLKHAAEARPRHTNTHTHSVYKHT